MYEQSMKPNSRRPLKRSLGQKSYRKMFFVAVEGKKTEPQYFDILKKILPNICIKCVQGGNKTSPIQILNTLKKFMQGEKFLKTDEAWIVIDKDSWTEEQLFTVWKWSQEDPRNGLAVSNPKFEYWLLQHFEEGNNISGSNECSKRLNKYIPNYDKGVKEVQITIASVEEAISRARRRDIPPCEDWPRNTGTTVYRLVMRMLNL
jgi:hypothetical protein